MSWGTATAAVGKLRLHKKEEGRLGSGVKLGVLSMLFGFLAAAQPPQFLSLAAGPPSPIVIVTAQAVPPVGAGSYCYWLIANYLIGHSTPSTPGCVNNVGGSVTVNWTPVSNASSYDILRTTTPILPNITSNIAVATLSGPGPIVDNFGALSSYSVNTAAPASAVFALDNQNQANPQVRLTVSNTAGFFNSFLLNAGGGVPGGATGTVQFNNSGFFGGFTVSGDFTLNTSTGVGTLATVNGAPGTCGDSSHVSQVVFNAKGLGTSCTPIAITAGTGNAAAIVTLGFSATPTYTAPSATAGTVVDFQNTSGNPIVLTGNITSSTLSGATPGSILNFLYKQDATGHRTVAMPPGFSPPVIHPAPNITTALTYWVDNGGNGRLISSFSDAGYGACSEGAAPTDTPPAGVEYSSCDSTRGTALQINSAGQTHIMPRTAGSTDQLSLVDLADGGNAVQAASAATGAKQICVSSGASKTCSYIDFPETLFIPAANCSPTAGAGWSIGSGGSVTCRAGTNNLGAYITISDTSSTFATFQIEIPEDWDTASNPYVRFQIASTDTTSGHTIIPSIQVACYKGDGSTTDDVVPNAAHSLSTITTNTTNHQFWSTANVQMNSTDVTGCVAGALMQITVGRATDTATNAQFYGATVTIPRLLTVQGN